MDYSENLIEGLPIPYVVFASNLNGAVNGQTIDIANLISNMAIPH